MENVMAQGIIKTRSNGTQVRLYADDNKDEVAEALAEMEADRLADLKELEQDLEEMEMA